jgi:hypothetical protein
MSAVPIEAVKFSDKIRKYISLTRQKIYNMQLCRQKNKHVKESKQSVLGLYTDSPQCNSRRNGEQVVSNENVGNKRETTGPNSAIRNVVMKTTVKGTKHCYKPNSFVTSLTK